MVGLPALKGSVISSARNATRQSPHILIASSLREEPAYIQCLPSSFEMMRSMLLLTPNGLLQRIQQDGSSSLRIWDGVLAVSKLMRGTSLMTCSGQVAWHKPHCTQASSTNRNTGLSGSSRKALVGQAETQDRQRVQPAVSISTAPTGDPGGSGTMPTGVGAERCSAPSEKRSTSRFFPTARKLTGCADGARGGIARRVCSRRSGSSVSMVAIRSGPKPSPARIESASIIVCANPETS